MRGAYLDMRPLCLPSLVLALLLHEGELAAAIRQDTAASDSVAVQDPEPVSVQRADQDEAIRATLQGAFDRVASLQRVEVTVDAGVVTLEGTVLRTETRDQAAALARGLDGVLFVDNRIRESTSMEEQLAPTWVRIRELGYAIVAKLPLLGLALVIITLAAVVGHLLARWGGPAFLHARNPFLQSLIRRLVQAIVVLTGIMLALDLLGATRLVAAVIGTAGLAGLAVGFAFKDIMENYLAGTIMAFRQPFAKNDHLRVAEFEGKLVRLTPRETILMTLDGNHVRIPNALILRSPMLNFSRNPLRRLEFDAGLGNGDDLALAREVAVAALAEMKGILRDPAPEARVMALGDSTVTMQFLAWVDQRGSDFDRVRSEAIRVVKARLEAAGHTMPSPEYLVRMSGEGDREAQPGRRPAAPAPTVSPADVAVDHTVDEQIETDRRESGEPDLLTQPADGRR